ncbi:uncharacterized protein LOC111087030 isoform X2 [Limulus polyphemus]|uniref:Uncharacterized protein LOC111087030 isoform X2 n=1 Tax=Limulus polyphemus TaxID=6850 RepID=A0ABM1SW84_LIMPO|nr:uncharacterized protein LOC111087030 isoform X2 [Limulus polyphemus]
MIQPNVTLLIPLCDFGATGIRTIEISDEGRLRRSTDGTNRRPRDAIKVNCEAFNQIMTTGECELLQDVEEGPSIFHFNTENHLYLKVSGTLSFEVTSVELCLVFVNHIVTISGISIEFFVELFVKNK